MIPFDRPYIIGETAFHHMGDQSFLMQLIDHAKQLELDAVKFHLLFDVHDYMIQNHEVIDTLAKWCFNANQWEEVLNYARSAKLELILLCNDVKSLQWVKKLDLEIRAIEIHATGINDIFLLNEASSFNGTVILGTGGSSLDEIQYAIDYLKDEGQKDLFLMHGFQNYPTKPSDVKLSRMKILNDIFDLPVGYADHTKPDDPSNAAISSFAAAMGYNVLEKHFTHKFGEERIDSQAAVSIAEMKKIKQLHTIAFETFGTNPLQMTNSERKYGNTGPMKKAIVARKTIEKGETLTIDKIAFKRTNLSSSLSQKELPKLLGLKTGKKIQEDEIIDYSNVIFEFTPNSFEQFNK